LHDFSDTAVHKLTAEILARPEYSTVAPKMPFWVEWLHRLSKLLDRLQLLHDSAPLLYWTIVAIVALVAITMIAHMIWTLRIAMRLPEAFPRRLPIGRSGPDPVREANMLARSGNYLEAGHCLMIATFHTLADRSIIELRPDRSNRWIRRAVRESPLSSRLADDVDVLVERTEHRWFGGRENESEIYTQWLSVLERLSAEVR
jgi:hypothetical protein